MSERFFIGRKREKQLLVSYLESDESEFIAVYGRRRVGKTYLIQQVIEDEAVFYVAGIHKAPKKEQLDNFMSHIPHKGTRVPKAKSWLEAFRALSTYLETLPEGRKIIFIDEMPWMDTPKSLFIAGLENFWNGWACRRNDIKLIVCGSATSWIINKLIRAKGGLHNRVTHKIPLQPFTLSETKQYFDKRGFRLNKKDVAEAYMILGGVPFYLKQLNKGESIAQNIDRVLFDKDGELHDEFQDVFESLFKNAENHIKVIAALAKKGIGMNRKELLEATQLPVNGDFSDILEELEQCGFIRGYDPYVTEEKARRRKGDEERHSPDCLYQIVDPFTLFHYQVFVGHSRDAHYWSGEYNSPKHSTWAGLGFEMLCLNHAEQIKKALGINGIHAEVMSWFGKGENRSAQIDMLIDRADGHLNLCEMKFYRGAYAMTQKDEDDIERKIRVLQEATKTDKSIIVTMITREGIKRNEHANIVQREVGLEELFE